MKSKSIKRQEAEERNAHWADLSPTEQLAHLDSHNLRAEKQRAKISRRIEKESKKR